MPPVVAVAAVAASAALAALPSIITKIGVSLILSGVQAAIGRAATSRSRSRSSGLGFAGAAAARTINVRQPIMPRNIVYGVTRIGGGLVYSEATDDNNFLHLVFVLAAHEVDGLEQVLFDDAAVDLDAAGGATGKYLGKAKIKRHLGQSGQAADADLVAASASWTADHRLDTIAYAYGRLTADRTLFPSGVPNISLVVRGKKVLDPRDGVVKFTVNPALILNDYLTDTKLGLGVDPARIDTDSVMQAANICEEPVPVQVSADLVTADAVRDVMIRTTGQARLLIGDVVRFTTTGTLPPPLLAGVDYYVRPVEFFANESGATSFAVADSFDAAMRGPAIDLTGAGTGTHTCQRVKEPRYTCNGEVTTAQAPRDIIEQILSAMMGKLVYSGGQWILHAGAHRPPSLTFDEGDMAGPVSVQPRVPRRELMNAVKGVFVDPYNLYQPTDFPGLASQSFAAEDGGAIWSDIDLAFTQSPGMAQRIAKQILLAARQQITVRLSMKPKALGVRAGDTISITDTVLGWSAKMFEVKDWTFKVGPAGGGAQATPSINIEMVLRETDPSIFDFTSSEEAVLDPAPNTNLPDASLVQPPGPVTLSSGAGELFTKQDGTIVSRLKVAWAASADGFVSEYEIEYKKSADTEWRAGGRTGAEIHSIHVWEVEDAVAYDARVRALSRLSRSAYATALGHVVQGKAAPPADVDGFCAQQNGNTVIFRWRQVGDRDLRRYEIRRSSLEIAVWEDGDVISQPDAGTSHTVAVVAPGIHRFYVKAIDSSGNQSVGAGTAVLSVISDFDVIFAVDQHADWPGEITDLVVHPTGVLTPRSAGVAADDGDATFDLYVPNPLPGIYTSAVFGLTVEDRVRIHGPSRQRRGPGQAGFKDAGLEVRFNKGTDDTDPIWVLTDDADPQWIDGDLDDELWITWNAWTEWSVGEVESQAIQHRLVVDPSSALPVVEAFTPIVDVLPRTERQGELPVGVGGTFISFKKQFHRPPSVDLTVTGLAARFAVPEDVTATGFTARVFDAAGTDVGGTVNYSAGSE